MAKHVLLLAGHAILSHSALFRSLPGWEEVEDLVVLDLQAHLTLTLADSGPLLTRL